MISRFHLLVPPVDIFGVSREAMAMHVCVYRRINALAFRSPISTKTSARKRQRERKSESRINFYFVASLFFFSSPSKTARTHLTIARKTFEQRTLDSLACRVHLCRTLTRIVSTGTTVGHQTTNGLVRQFVLIVVGQQQQRLRT